MQEQEALFKIIYQIVTLVLLALTGFTAGRTRYLPESSGMVLSKVVVKLTAPILIVTTMADYSFTPKMLADGAVLYLLGIAFLLLAFFISVITSKWVSLEASTANIYKMLSMFGNVMFLAYPLLLTLYGEKGIIYAVFFNLSNDTLLWTLGVYLANKHNTSRWRDNLKHLINGNTVAFALGMVFILTNFKGYVENAHPFARGIYDLLINTFGPLGKTTIYLSMVFIGLILSEVRFKSMSDIFKRYPLMLLSFFKLLLVPAAAILILKWAGSGIDIFIKEILVLQLAMPCGTIVAAVAAQHDSDYRFATEGVFFSTILSAVTIPLIVFLLKFL